MDRNALAVANLRLADGLAYKHACRTGFDFDEYRGVARLKLVECSRRYRPGAASFASFAFPRIKGALIDEDRRRTGFRRPHVKHENGALVEAREQIPEDAVSRDTGPFEQAVNSELWRIVDRLPRSESIAVRMRFAEKAKLHEIGDALGVTEGRACQLVSAGLKALRKHL